MNPEEMVRHMVNKTEQLKIVVKVFIKNLCKPAAAKEFSFDAKEAEDLGCFEETAITAQEKDKFFEDFCLRTYAQVPEGAKDHGK
ncbi:hypothetical protein TURTL08_06400 [Turicimonas sp. TL08]